jgi:hypothetical protein
MDEGKLEEIRQRAEKATEGPYEVRYYEWTDGGVRLANKGISAPSDSIAFHASNYPKGTERGDQDLQDMEFLAHARVDVPALISALEESRREVERLERIAKAAEDVLDYTGPMDNWNRRLDDGTFPWSNLDNAIYRWKMDSSIHPTSQ